MNEECNPSTQEVNKSEVSANTCRYHARISNQFFTLKAKRRPTLHISAPQKLKN
ncbi:DYW_deaminase domain-containing protein [Psidium guajava]|nr:DYW_deaminase domain-containing protein [Psidium guajava]